MPVLLLVVALLGLLALTIISIRRPPVPTVPQAEPELVAAAAE